MIATVITGIIIFISFVIISCILAYLADKFTSWLLHENKK